METGKTGKYFKYAIGEIILVVIGILIALQINNWNEARILNEHQLAYLDNLKKEVLQNDIDLKLKIEDHKKIANKLNELSDLMSPNPALISTNKLDSLMFSMAYLPVYNPIKTFTNSNTIETIDHTELKYLVAEWNFILENYEYGTQILYDLYYNGIYPFLQDNYQMRNLKSEGNNLKNSRFLVDTKKILSSSVFENQITMKLLNTESMVEDALLLSVLQEKIIESIDNIILEKQ